MILSQFDSSLLSFAPSFRNWTMEPKNKEFESSNTLLTTVHNPESVVEIYVDQQREFITEIKHLNYNRVKSYVYPFSEYRNKIRHTRQANAFMLALFRNN